ncbi:MAG: RnfABCDGE type electron transport complex subunit B [Clostridia bacterium]|nr:RnfABCDGE type electron transport complex subunit B [Clostridia bacterium]
MMEILLPIMLVGGISLLAGAGLAVASILMAVPTDEKYEAIRECLPGANCGACGFSGCDGYAAALASGETTESGLCAPGGADVTKQIAALLGVEADASRRKVAVIHCIGRRDHNAETKMNYHGTKSCRTAKQLYGGDNACAYGCIGLGDCRKFCPFEAITLEDGFPIVHKDQCKGCGMCVNACPKNLITLEECGATYTVRCRNQSKGAACVKICKTSCIGCGLCAKVCESGAVKIEQFCATIDSAKCTACGKCKDACKRGAITVQ